MPNEFREDPRWPAALGKLKREFLDTRLGPPILADMTASAPVDTGALRDSLRVDVLDDDHLRFSTDRDYAAAVHDGHEIAYRGPDGQTVHTGRYVDGRPYMTGPLYRARGGGS
ncbi:MAG: HK97 gp10 family phage protein [Streptomycetaceae bacterium]|nr:HK97 gp10 family phage protein [Streptomycetaceae bacterium]